jgi:hypothetical protein
VYLLEEGKLEGLPAFHFLRGGQARCLGGRLGGSQLEIGLHQVFLEIPRLIEECHIDVLDGGLEQLQVLLQIRIGSYQAL